jgi:hypothetical protein
LGKNYPPQNGCRWNPFFFFQKHRFHILHFPNSTGVFTKPTGRHYTKYRFSPDIVPTPPHGNRFVVIFALREFLPIPC